MDKLASIIKIFAYSVLALVLVGILISVLVYKKQIPLSINLGSWIGGYSYENSDAYSIGNAVIDAAGIKKVDIDWVSGSVEVKTTSSDKVSINENDSDGLEEKFKLRYLVKDGILYIRFCEPFNVSTKFPDNHRKSLVVTVPENLAQLENFTLNTVSADSDVSGISSKNVKMNSVSGRVTIKLNGKADFFEGNTTSGDINILCDVDELKLHSVSGKATIDGSFIKASVNTTSGSAIINVTNKPEKITVGTVSGRTKITLMEDFGFTAKLSTVSGNLNCSLPVTTSGKFNVKHGDGFCNIDVSSVSGGLTIQ